jgi:hypothetical protein
LTTQLGFTWDADASAVRDSQGVLMVDAEGIQGAITYFSRDIDALEVLGWGIDAAQSQALKAVLIFDGDQLIWQGKTPMLREETHSFGVVIAVGFSAVLPLDRLSQRDGSGLRIFAVTDDRRVRELLLKEK